MPEAVTASDAVFYSIVHWGTDLKAQGKIVGGALLDPGGLEGVPDGLLILNVKSLAEAEEIATSWPVGHRVHVDLLPVMGNF
jgi:hypothetical protein